MRHTKLDLTTVERQADMAALRAAVRRRKELPSFTLEWQQAIEAEGLARGRVRRWNGNGGV